ncbi:MAG TPA: cation diffusion facilitator family transporter [Acidimicrobiales bacterium]|nr:cation diffusion facilitator family transporter [Acidimicrobiales bacterium]
MEFRIRGRDHGSPRTVLTALAANLAIAVAKFIAFAFTGSASMLAEGIHSVADTSNQALLLVGRRRSRRRATVEHPFGFGQEAYFSAFLVAIVLFSLGSLFSLFEGFDKLRHPHEVESLGWAVAVLVFAMVSEGWALRTAAQAARPELRGSWWSYVRDTRSPENAVVLLEDSAAEIGLTAALMGILATAVTGDARYDAVGTMVIGLVLGFVAIVLAIEMRSLLIGESADDEDLGAIRGVFASVPAVERVVDLRTMHMGPDDILVAARVELDAGLDADEAGACIAQITAAIRAQVPEAQRVYIEPEPGIDAGGASVVDPDEDAGNEAEPEPPPERDPRAEPEPQRSPD